MNALSLKGLTNGRILLLVFILPLIETSCQKNATDSEFKFPADFPSIQYKNLENQLTPQKIHLGRVLFYDPNLSSTRTISCGSCHAQVHGFADHNLPKSFGVHNRIGMRNSPALQNLAWNTHFMWDGGITHLDVMPIAPITDVNEMDLPLGEAIERIRENKQYHILFKKAYGDTIINEKTVLFALSQFMLTLVSDQSKYDDVRRGKTSFNQIESKGYQVFKNHCVKCHSEPLLTNNQMEYNGLTVKSKDLGRFRITQTLKDTFHFKVPSLRNVALTYPYMHDGSFSNLDQVLKAYQTKFQLENHDLEALRAFLNTLTDHKFISNLNHAEIHPFNP
jgi:cytochrome c peroxidase